MFDDLPRLLRMRAVGSVSSRGGVTTRTFTVPMETPWLAIQSYEHVLQRAQWKLVVRVQSVGTSAYQGAWQRGGYHLLVTTARGPEADESGGESVAQLSLELFARGTPLTTLARR
ncbi:MAG TPA: hypothetical protein VH914_08150 [Acidimicrobiia bacterium]|jgi:hypothetical protein|nr:hypothetical protein [Acidimicrobiia bacterium]